MQQQDYELLTKFGRRIKELRTKQNKSLNNFSFNSELLTSATVSRIENGLVDLKFSTLIKLANALDMKPEEVLHDFDFKYETDL
ncbi:XRE family transcriptional regulator [Candidatus Gastranaerophilales bacterium]|nr:MAG: XRE family transcriptional regulator [Candidatus Gastranaerophilales bacterium]